MRYDERAELLGGDELEELRLEGGLAGRGGLVEQNEGGRRAGAARDLWGGVGLYTILPSPILYGIYSNAGGRGETQHRVILWAIQRAGGVPKQKGCLHRILLMGAQKPRHQLHILSRVNPSCASKAGSHAEVGSSSKTTRAERRRCRRPVQRSTGHTGREMI